MNMLKRKSIPKHPRKNRSILKAREFILESRICSLPIDPKVYFDIYNWRLLTWEEAKIELNEKDPLNLRKVKAEARTFVPRDTSKTLTVYDTTVFPSRIRWTLAHEIGHIFLGHFQDFQKTILSRSVLTLKEYKVLEREAHYFAAEILGPMHVLKKIGVCKADEIQKVCDISKEAATNRERDLVLWSHEQITDEMVPEILKRFELYVNAGNLKNGATPTMEKKHLFIASDGDHRFVQCPKCGNRRFSNDAKYCKLCGMYIYNYCTHEECGKANPGDARHCEYCGWKTQLAMSNLLMSWEEVLENHKEIAAGLMPEDDLPY